MFEELAPAEYARLLADIWADRGWTTDVQEREGTSGFLVAGDRETGTNAERGLILVRPDDEGVDGQDLQEFVQLCEEKQVDVRVVATRGSFGDRAEQVAAANDVHLLDPEALAATVREEGLEHLVERYDAAGSADDGRSLALDLPPDALSDPSFPGGAFRLLVVAVLVLAAFGAGTLASGALFGNGGDDFPVSAVSTAGPNETADLAVRWRAVERSTLTVGGSSYDAPPGERFVVVQFVVTNRGEEARAIRPRRFVFAANGTIHARQRLNGTTYFPPTRIPAGGETSRWTVFSVPKHATSGTILVDQEIGPGPVAIRFVRDPGLALNLTAAG